MCNCDAITMHRFVEYLSQVALRLPTNQELQELESVLVLDSDELPSERHLHSVQTSSRTSAASLDHGAVALSVEEPVGPSSLPPIEPIAARSLYRSATYELPTTTVAECVPTVKG